MPSLIRPPDRAIRGGAGLKLLAFLTIVAAFVAIAWMLLLPLALTRQMSERARLAGVVHRFTFNPFSGYIEMGGLLIENPAEFRERPFAAIEHLTAQAERFSLFSSQPAFSEVKVEIARLTLVFPPSGPSNVEALNERFRWSGGRRLDAPGEPPEHAIVIRRLAIKVGQIDIVDHREPGTVTTRTIDGFDLTLPGPTEIAPLRGGGSAGMFGPIEVIVGGLIPGVIARAAAEAAARTRPDAGAAIEKPRGFLGALEESRKP